MMIPLEPPVIPSYSYPSGSLPRFSQNSRQVAARYSMSLTRANSMRNSWAVNRSSVCQAPKSTKEQHSPQSIASSIAPSDSVSVSSRYANSVHHQQPSFESRTKYNTLTPAEAKKLNLNLKTRHQPARTASVLHKPRAPPMVVTNLDDFGLPAPRSSSPYIDAYDHLNGLPTEQSRKKVSNNSRSNSSCSNYIRRHDTKRHSTTQDNSCSTTNNFNKGMAQSSPDDSESNLSFRSSLDIVDSAYGSDRLQTMSVDLGNPSQQYNSYKRPDNQQEQQNKLSDESYASAKSYQSESNSKLKSSLSSSTSKVFQNQLFNLKKFFRYMPNVKRSVVDSSETKRDKTSDRISLNESISQICLNRSQSPPVCPPPPRELKSMSYMESAVNYSNYDEFTKVRNQQASSLLNGHVRAHQATREAYGINDHRGFSAPNNCDDQDSWQLTSLPVSYERNLTTVFEEKQMLGDLNSKLNDNNSIRQNFNLPSNNKGHLITPPANFDEKCYSNGENIIQNSLITENSSQSLNSITTADSVLDFHRQTAASFRFSYAQPGPFENQGHAIQTNTGLPPRMPNYELKTGNSSGTPSNNSSLVNESNNCDHQISSGEDRTPNYDDTLVYSNTNGMENDADTTIVSDSSTLHGDSNSMVYINRCNELERTVESLKNKLITKEKELTDLQLKQWSSDYLIEQLKSTISKLEKENAQIKAVMVKVNRVNI